MYLNFDRALEIMATIYKIRAQLDKNENSRVYTVPRLFTSALLLLLLCRTKDEIS